jgi:hypothetical protein
MECYFLISEFFGGLILLMGVGYLIGHKLFNGSLKKEYYRQSLASGV